MPVVFNTLEKCFMIETDVRLKNIRLCVIFFTTIRFHTIEHHNIVFDIFLIFSMDHEMCA